MAAIQTEEVAGKEARVLTDEEIIKVLAKESKKRGESAEIYHRERPRRTCRERARRSSDHRRVPADAVDRRRTRRRRRHRPRLRCPRSSVSVRVCVRWARSSRPPARCQGQGRWRTYLCSSEVPPVEAPPETENGRELRVSRRSRPFLFSEPSVRRGSPQAVRVRLPRSRIRGSRARCRSCWSCRGCGCCRSPYGTVTDVDRDGRTRDRGPGRRNSGDRSRPCSGRRGHGIDREAGRLQPRRRRRLAQGRQPSGTWPFCDPRAYFSSIGGSEVGPKLLATGFIAANQDLAGSVPAVQVAAVAGA